MNKIITAIILLCTIGLMFLTIFGTGTITFISMQNMNGIMVYKYDLYSYIEEIKRAFSNVSGLELQLPENNFADFISAIRTLINYIILPFNILLYPIRVGAYALRSVFSILGFPVISYTTDNPLYWLWEMIRILIGLQIPYV